MNGNIKWEGLGTKSWRLRVTVWITSVRTKGSTLKYTGSHITYLNILSWKVLLPNFGGSILLYPCVFGVALIRVGSHQCELHYNIGRVG